MDIDIVKLILMNSGEDISKIDLENCGENDDEFQSTTPEVTSALAKSLATLFCHRVSPAAHQRYLVRTNLIEQLRDWSRITRRYAHLQIFTDGERTTKFAINLVKKYLTYDFIEKQSSVDVLVKLTFALIDMKLKNPTFDYELDNIINKILYLDKTDESNIFLNFLIEEYENFSLALPTIENIYICRAKNLIEEPIVQFYILYHENYKNGNFDSKTIENRVDSAVNNSTHYLCDRLFKYSSKSPRIFQLLSSVMREILALKDFCEIVVNFIQFVLTSISKLCDEEGNKILDLYPRNLQCAVILMRIEPNLHTNNTKKYAINVLKSIYSLKKQEFLVLLTHFPLWLTEVSDFTSDSNNFR